MKLIFKHKRPEGNDIWSFAFTPIEPFSWEAGQSIRVEVAGPYGSLEHRFSVSSAPSSGEVAITTRLNENDYKTSLAALRPGDEADAYGLEGDFTWRRSDLPHILVAAGIGITPYHAMLAERAQQSHPLAATLIYGSSDNPPVFKDYLDAWARKYTEFGVNYISGRVDVVDILAEQNAMHRTIYVSGPSKMVDTICADLIAAGVDPVRILTDQFTGRLPTNG